MALPVAAIVCIVLACWVLLVLILFAVYQLLKSRGTCECQCAPCGKEESGGCCECCISLSDSCNCCSPSVNGCLDKVCPGKKKVSCVDILLCQCCASEGEDSCCMKILPSCGCCESDCCSSCRDCEGIVCCCLEIRLVSNKSVQGKDSTVPQTRSTGGPKKYLTQSSTESRDSADEETNNKPALRTKTNTVKKETMRALPTSPPMSARSTSQLILVPKKNTSNSTGAKKVVAKKFLKSQSLDLPKTSTKDIKSTGNSGVLKNDDKKPKRRSLPDTPRDENNSQTSKSVLKKSKRSVDGKENERFSELREVEVKQNSFPLHTLNSHSVARAMSLGSLQSGSQVSFTLSDIGNSQITLSGESFGNSSYMLLPVGYDIPVHSTSSGFVSSQGEYGSTSGNLDVQRSEVEARYSTLKSNTGTATRRPLPVPSGR